MNISSADKQFVWHPFTQHYYNKDFPLISRAEGAYLFTPDGKKIYDAISSWWTCTHGHCHPFIVGAVKKQLDELDHVLFAGFTHEQAVKCASQLLKFLPANQSKVFFSDDGSTSVEIALKMALQFWINGGKPRKRILAFRNGYHGDTFGAMSLGATSGFFEPFAGHLLEVDFIDVPDAASENKSMDDLMKHLKQKGDTYACFIYEPLVQGAAGMRMYQPEALEQILISCKKHGILLIADEVMTGFGRTGKMFASDHLKTQPDIFCLSKGITGGFMALGVTTATNEIFDAFLDPDRKKMFLHGHSYTANPIACSAAVASLELFSQPATWEKIHAISNEFAKHRVAIENSRSLGTIFATELSGSNEYFSDTGQVNAFFLERGVLVRVLANVLYAMPPYCGHGEEYDPFLSVYHEYVNSQR